MLEAAQSRNDFVQHKLYWTACLNSWQLGPCTSSPCHSCLPKIFWRGVIVLGTEHGDGLCIMTTLWAHCVQCDQRHILQNSKFHSSMEFQLMDCFGEYMKSGVVFARHSIVDYQLVRCEIYQSLPFLPTFNHFFIFCSWRIKTLFSIPASYFSHSSDHKLFISNLSHHVIQDE